MRVRLIQSLSFARDTTTSVEEFVGDALEGDVYDSNRTEQNGCYIIALKLWLVCVMC